MLVLFALELAILYYSVRLEQKMFHHIGLKSYSVPPGCIL